VGPKVETPSPETRTDPDGEGRETFAVFGLGNPGERYLRTRHNLGFLLVELLVDRLGARPRSGAPDAIHHEAEIEDKRVHLLRPLTWMNRSGIAVDAFLAATELNLSRVLVAVDDTALELGKLRLRARGSHGGHNGLRSIEERLGTGDYARLRMGCGPAPEEEDLADFVLGEFAADEEAVVDELLDRAANAVRSWVLEGTSLTMSRFNG
jgi:PTH1 family peptidyl-tRNA hydrolase